MLDAMLATGNRVPHARLREPANDHQVLHVDFTKLADQTAAMFALAIPQDRTERSLLAPSRPPGSRARPRPQRRVANHPGSSGGIVVGIRFGDQLWRIIEQAVDENLSGPRLNDHIVDLAQQLFGPGSVGVLWHTVYHKYERCAGRLRPGRIILAGDAGHLTAEPAAKA